MNKKLLELLNQINAQKQVVIDLANAGKLAEAKAEKEKLQQMQDKFDLLKDVEDKSLFYDAKTILQEMVQAGPDSRLQYVLTREAGPDHAKEFTVETRIGGKTYAIGKGKTKKGAEQIAAYQTILLLKKQRV